LAVLESSLWLRKMKYSLAFLSVILCLSIASAQAKCTYIEEYCGTSPSGVVVHWKWVNEAEGLIEWTFNNTGSSQASVILNRGATYNGVPLVPPYVFAAAYFPAYLYDGLAQYFYGKPVPLRNYQAEYDLPIGMLDVDGHYWTVFVFTLAPGQVFRMEEGGYIYEGSNIFPYCQNVDDITYEGSAVFTIQYHKNEQCHEFDSTQPCPPENFDVGSAYYSIKKGLVNSTNFWPSAGDNFTMNVCLEEGNGYEESSPSMMMRKANRATLTTDVDRLHMSNINRAVRSLVRPSKASTGGKRVTRIL